MMKTVMRWASVAAAMVVTVLFLLSPACPATVRGAASFSAAWWNPQSVKTEIVVSHTETATASPSNAEDMEEIVETLPAINVENQPAPKQGKGGMVTEKQMTGSYIVENIAVKNNAGRKLDIAKEFQILPKIPVKSTDEPQVLILHTHTTECYLTYDAGFYNDTDPTRSRDPSVSVVAVGEAIASELRAAGIGVIHDTTEHDYPQYTGAYTRSLATAQRIVNRYPSIVSVLDIHRDSISGKAGEKIKPTVAVDGRKAAQMMILTSVSDSTDVPHPHWQENFRFALQLQNRLSTAYDGIMRPLNIVGARYNQHLAPASLLLEVGSEVNTLAEAVFSGKLFGRQMANLLIELKTEASS